MHVLLAWLFRGLIYLFGYFFRGFLHFLHWTTTSTIGGMLMLGGAFFVIFTVFVNFFEDLIFKFFPILPTDDYRFVFGSEMADIIDHGFMNLLGDDPFSAVFQNVLYIVSIGSVINSFIDFCLPFLLTCWTYKFIKSWLPTLSD